MDIKFYEYNSYNKYIQYDSEFCQGIILGKVNHDINVLFY